MTSLRSGKNNDAAQENSANSAQGIPEDLRRPLIVVERRRRLLRWCEGTAEAVLAAIMLLAVTMTIDRFLHPQLHVRKSLLIGAALVVVAIFWFRGVAPLFRRRNLVTTARAIEADAPRLQEQLSSAIELGLRANSGASRWMIARTIALATQHAVQINPAKVVSAKRARRLMLVAGVALGGTLALGFYPEGRSWLIRALVPGSSPARPSHFTMHIRPERSVVSYGASLLIEARIEPEPNDVTLLVQWDDGVTERRRMVGIGNSYQVNFSAITRGLQGKLSADGNEGPEISVVAVDPPRLGPVVLTISPPVYTGLLPRQAPAGDIEVVAGSRIVVSVPNASDDLRGAVLVRENGEEFPLAMREDRTLSATFMAEVSGTWGLRIVGADGLMVEPSAHWLLTVRPDAPPLVNLRLGGVLAEVAAPGEIITCHVQTTDDHGLQSVELIITDGRSVLERRDLLSGRVGAPRQVDRSEDVDLSDFALLGGETLYFSIEAVDQGGLKTSGESKSVRIVDAMLAEAERLRHSIDIVLQSVDASLIDLRGFGKHWENLQRSFRPDDPASQKGELLLLRARLGKICERMLASSEGILDLGVNTPLPVGDKMMANADILSAWGMIYGSIFSNSSTLLERDRDLEDLRMFQDMNEAALRSLENARGLLAMMAARLEAETLLGTMIDLEGKAQNAAQILQMKAAWAAEAWTPGLEMRIYAGTEFASEIETKMAVLPSHQTALTGGRDQDLSVRWRGDILVRSSGKYTFRAVVDDGVRVSVAGLDVLPQAAWSWQAPTPYEGSIDVSAGWHPILIEFRQGDGGALLELSWSKHGEEAKPLSFDVLRCRDEVNQDGGILSKMGATSLSAMVNAKEILSAALETGATMGASIERLALETGAERLKTIVARAQPVAEALNRDLRGEWEHLHPAIQIERLVMLRQEVQRARDVLAEGTDRMRGYSSALSIERAMLREMRDCVEALRRIRGNQPESDRLAAIRRERTVISWSSSALATRFMMRRKALLERAGNETFSVRERNFALSARNTLAWSAASALASLSDILGYSVQEPKEMAAQIDAALKVIEQTMLLAQADIDRADGDVAAEVFDRFVTNARIMEVSPDSLDAKAKMLVEFDRLVRQLKATGRRSDSERVCALYEKWRNGNFGKGMEAQLSVMFRREQIPGDHAESALINMQRAIDLLHESEAGAHESSMINEMIESAREELHTVAIRLQLASLSHRENDADRSVAFRDLSGDCMSLAQSLSPTKQAATEISQRIHDLMAEREFRTERAEDLIDLIGLIRQAIADPQQRPAALERIMTVMPSDMNSPEQIDEQRRMQDIDSLAEALEQERIMAIAEERERAEFALSESLVAESLERFLTALAPSAVYNRESMADVIARAVVNARRRSELARAGSRLPGAESMTLAVDAWSGSTTLAEEVGAALARQAMDRSEGGRDEVAELGLLLAETIDQQRIAAAKLEQFSARRAWQRTRLARAYAQAHNHFGDSHLPAESGLLEDLDRLRNLADDAMQTDANDSTWLNDALRTESAWIEHLHMAVSDPAISNPGNLASVVAHANAARMQADALVRMAKDSASHSNEAHRYEMLAHQYLMRLTSDLPRRADMGLDALRNLGPATTGRNDDSIDEAAIRETARAVLAAPDSDAAWRHAERTLAMALALQQAGSVGIGESADPQAIDLDHAQVVEPMDPGLDQAEWMRSQGAVHGDVQAAGIEAFSEEYREAIRSYFQHMGASR